jgi:hypothetical protein
MYCTIGGQIVLLYSHRGGIRFESMTKHHPFVERLGGVLIDAYNYLRVKFIFGNVTAHLGVWEQV